MDHSENYTGPAPLALFAYRRPGHLARTLEALRTNPEAHETPIYVFSDGPRDPGAEEGVRQVRQLLNHVDGFASVQLVFRNENVGLARNITAGVSEVLDRHDRVVVVEDDVVVSPFFLRFMNEALSYYRDEPRVGSISGYCYPVSRRVPETFFIRGADCWGWATWRNRWKYFNPDGAALLKELQQRKLTHKFDFDGAMAFTQMLSDQFAGKNDSWAVRWHASCFLRDMLILYPGRPLAQNIGQDGSGTHGTTSDDSYDVALSRSPVVVGGIPIGENTWARAAIREFFTKSQPRARGEMNKLFQNLCRIAQFVRRAAS
jgi:hypothetical protein